MFTSGSCVKGLGGNHDTHRLIGADSDSQQFLDRTYIPDHILIPPAIPDDAYSCYKAIWLQ